MYKILPEEEHVELSICEMKEKYTYFTIVYTVRPSSDNIRPYYYVPLAILLDDAGGNYTNAVNELKKTYPQYTTFSATEGFKLEEHMDRVSGMGGIR